jgi:hypothetical protein
LLSYHRCKCKVEGGGDCDRIFEKRGSSHPHIRPDESQAAGKKYTNAYSSEKSPHWSPD